MLLHIVEVRVVANHSAGFVFGLVHDFAVVGPSQLGNGDERRLWAVRRVAAA
jgi:hypothetical protein